MYLYEKSVDEQIMPEQYRKIYEQMKEIEVKHSQGRQHVDISFLERLITGS